MATFNSVNKSCKLFSGTINSAFSIRGDKLAVRHAKVQARRHAKVLGYLAAIESGEIAKPSGKVQKLSPARLVQQVLSLTKTVAELHAAGDTSIDVVAQVAALGHGNGQSTLVERCDWQAARDAILGWAKEVGVSLTVVGRIFGLCEEKDVIIPSEPESTAVVEPGPAKTEQKSSKGRKAA